MVIRHWSSQGFSLEGAATASVFECFRALGYDFDLLGKPVHPANLMANIRSHPTLISHYAN
jgi:hypothetical protein